MNPFIAPTITGVGAALASWHWKTYPSFVDASSVASFGGTVASISTTMLGFLLAALAVLASISHTHLLKVMREQGYYRDLLDTMLVDFLLFLLCAVLGISLLFGFPLTPYAACVAVGFHAAAFVSLMDVGRKLWFVLRNLK